MCVMKTKPISWTVCRNSVSLQSIHTHTHPRALEETSKAVQRKHNFGSSFPKLKREKREKRRRRRTRAEAEAEYFGDESKQICNFKPGTPAASGTDSLRQTLFRASN